MKKLFVVLIFVLGCSRVNEPENNSTNDYFPLEIGSEYNFNYSISSHDSYSGGYESGSIIWVINRIEENLDTTIFIIDCASVGTRFSRNWNDNLEVWYDSTYSSVEKTSSFAIKEFQDSVFIPLSSLDVGTIYSQYIAFGRYYETSIDTLKLTDNSSENWEELFLGENVGLLQYKRSYGGHSHWTTKLHRIL